MRPRCDADTESCAMNTFQNTHALDPEAQCLWHISGCLSNVSAVRIGDISGCVGACVRAHAPRWMMAHAVACFHTQAAISHMPGKVHDVDAADTCLHTHAHPHMNGMLTCTHARMLACTHARRHACMHARMRACKPTHWTCVMLFAN